MNTEKIKGANLSNFIPLITILADTKIGVMKKKKERANSLSQRIKGGIFFLFNIYQENEYIFIA